MENPTLNFIAKWGFLYSRKISIQIRDESLGFQIQIRE